MIITTVVAILALRAMEAVLTLPDYKYTLTLRDRLTGK